MRGCRSTVGLWVVAVVELALALVDRNAWAVPEPPTRVVPTESMTPPVPVQPAPTRLEYPAPQPTSEPAGPSPAPPRGWYDATPWLSWLRPELRASVASRAGIARIEDLALCDLRLKVDTENRRFALREMVYLTNPGPGSRSE